MQAKLIKLLDLPPVWTLGGVLVISLLGMIGFFFGFGDFGAGLALACVAIAAWLIGSAVLTMRAHHTTVHPRGTPNKLLTDGVFAISRNPIYLGFVFLLVGATFWSGSLLGFLVVAGFMVVITDRFIDAEEEVIKEKFPEEASLWFLRTRRWL